MKIDSAVFYTDDINKCVEFYRVNLIFKIEYQQSDKFVSFIFDDGSRLGIKKASEERELPGAQTAFISCDDIESYYQNIRQKGLNIYKELSDENWGKNFSILDVDGNKLQFVSRKQIK